MSYNYIPKYIRQSENKRPKDVVTASRWNTLFNLLIQQGNHTAEELGKILDYLSIELVGVESEIAESAEAIANIREVFRINVTYSNGVYSADKTFAEIKAAYEAGQQPYVVYDGNTIYTLSYCYFASEQMFVDFERYLIGEDTLKTETLRIYSYTTASGSNIVKRTSPYNGQDVIGIQSVVQTVTSTEDGGANIITVTKTDGTSSTFTVKNGSKGSTGAVGAPGIYYGTTQPTGDTHPVWIDPSGGQDDGGLLPVVTAADNGKFLRVVSGAWAAATLPIYGGESE